MCVCVYVCIYVYIYSYIYIYIDNDNGDSTYHFNSHSSGRYLAAFLNRPEAIPLRMPAPPPPKPVVVFGPATSEADVLKRLSSMEFLATDRMEFSKVTALVCSSVSNQYTANF